MRYETRDEVESIGKAGAAYYVREGQVYARQLSSFWLAVDMTDLGYCPHAINDGYWESWITSWMSKQYNAGDLAIDIGANHGYYSFMMQQAGVQTMAVEPQAKLCDLMRRSVFANMHMKNRVEVVPAAASDVNGEKIVMNVPESHGMDASMSTFYTPSAPFGLERQEVETVSLDSLVPALSKVHFIKIDVEGAEPQVWEGMKHLWSRHHPTTVLEFCWNRYEHPEEFGRRLLAEAEVSYVDFDAQEFPVEGFDHLASKKNEDWMLVLRKKK